MGFIQVFSLEDKEKLVRLGYRFLREQMMGGKKTFLFEYHKLNFEPNDFENIKYRITNTMWF